MGDDGKTGIDAWQIKLLIAGTHLIHSIRHSTVYVRHDNCILYNKHEKQSKAKHGLANREGLRYGV
jgi:hypothetical protein